MPASAWRLFPPEHTTLDKGHGRVETRRIWSSERINDYINFPHAKQVACVQREVYDTSTKVTRMEQVYLVTSLSRSEAGPAKLLELNRKHWGIENKLHYVRDMAYDEDRCRARTGNSARALACLRNFSISLLRSFNVTNIKAGLRDLTADAAKVLKMLGL